MSKPTIDTIERLTKAHAEHRAELAERVAALDEELRAAKARYLRSIRGAVLRAKESRLELHNAIDAARELFERPRSRILHGIRVGLQKGKGKVAYEDADQVVALIKKRLPDQADVLIATEEKPVKSALVNLSADDLMRIGCKIEGTGDEVLIKPADSEVDKLVAALLDDQEESVE